MQANLSISAIVKVRFRYEFWLFLFVLLPFCLYL